ncbi:glutamate--tRNA ligase [Pseudonocardia alni]|uniref:glutamate--tRNA ligase n=1 Tax=Pseudonocardia alni TaxID=33907 RepID=UPI00280BA31D|nr:glutamate--tRNA ligase [Pseudonocardia alni]
MSTPAQVRVRFSPSPTGTPHVGLIRTALFNWAHARHHGGALVFRIEDTDASRDSDESYRALLDALEWLGLDWDEGVEKGGPHGPYRQSERGEVYADALRRLIDAGEVYESYSSAEEIEARHRAAGRDPKLGYDNADRDLTEDQRAAFRAEGRAPVYRLRMPDHDITFTDLVRGEITFRAGQVPDFVLARGDGTPLYPLTNPVDDALMEITHVLRGEDLLASTPRQIALLEALARVGIGHGPFTYAHLPLVTGEGNRKLSKRDPQSNLFHYRDRGFVPEGLLNYLALLGWSIAEDRDVFSLDEMVAAFDVSRVSSNAARFDLKKAEAINAAHLRLLAPEDFAERVVPHLAAEGIADPDRSVLAAAAPLVQERSQVLSDAARMLAFLFRDEDTFTPDDDAAAKNLGADAAPVLEAAVAGLTDLPEWSAAAIEESLKTSLVDGLELKPRKAFAPVRVAISGRTVSPPLYESMELLGRERSLSRLGAGVRRSQGMG